MTAPIPPLRKRSTMSWGRRPTPREIADRSNRNVNGGGASGKRNSQVGAAQTHKLDDIAEYLLSPQGKETVGLVLIAAASLALIYALHHA